MVMTEWFGDSTTRATGTEQSAQPRPPRRTRSTTRMFYARVALGVLTAEEQAAAATIDGVGDAVWTDLMGLSMSAPVVARPRRS